jgi:carboxypeptidase T
MRKISIIFTLILLTFSLISAFPREKVGLKPSLPLSPSAGEEEVYYIVRVDPRLSAVTRIVSRLNLDVMGSDRGYWYLLVKPAEIRALYASKVPFQLVSVEKPDVSLTRDRKVLPAAANGPFHSYWEVQQELLALERDYPGIVKVYDIGDSIAGRDILAVKISDNVGEEEEDEVDCFFVGCHHAREWISVEVPLLLARYLVEHYGEDPRITGMIEKSEVWIVPLLNPDGLEYSINAFRWWRKNMRDNEDGTFGVDLNRNYDYMWGIDDMGSSPNTYSEVYRGSAPFSEPETAAIARFFDKHNFRVSISYHSFAQMILYPWGYCYDLAPDYSLFSFLGDTMASLITAVHGRWYYAVPGGSGMYFTNGEFTDWAYGKYGTLAFTIELPPVYLLEGGFINADSDIPSIFEENLPAALYLIEWAIANK